MDFKTFWLTYFNDPGKIVWHHYLGLNLTNLTITIITTMLITLIIEVAKYAINDKNYTDRTEYLVSFGNSTLVALGSFIGVFLLLSALSFGIYPLGYLIVTQTMHQIHTLNAISGLKITWGLLFIVINSLLWFIILKHKTRPQSVKLMLNLTTISLTGIWGLMTLSMFKYPFVIVFLIGGFLISALSTGIAELIDDLIHPERYADKNKATTEKLAKAKQL